MAAERTFLNESGNQITVRAAILTSEDVELEITSRRSHTSWLLTQREAAELLNVLEEIKVEANP